MYSMFDKKVFRNITPEKCKEIGEYLSKSTDYNIKTNWREDEYDINRYYCEFIFENINDLDLIVHNSKIGKIHVFDSDITDNYIFDSYANTFGASNSKITYFGTHNSEIEHCGIDNSQVDYLTLDNVDITEELKFEDTKASLIVGQVRKS